MRSSRWDSMCAAAASAVCGPALVYSAGEHFDFGTIPEGMISGQDRYIAKVLRRPAIAVWCRRGSARIRHNRSLDDPRSFEPARLNGQPVAHQATIEVTSHLY